MNIDHRPIVLTDTVDYRTIGFLHYRPNHRHELLAAACVANQSAWYNLLNSCWMTTDVVQYIYYTLTREWTVHLNGSLVT